MSLDNLISDHIEARLQTTYTSIPAQVVSVGVNDYGRTIVNVQTGVNRITQDGRAYEDQVIEGVPILWPSSGGCFITCPIAENDTVYVHFAMRNTSKWRRFTSALLNRPTSPFINRHHDINDAYAVPAALFEQESPVVDQNAVRISSGKTEIRVTKDGTIEFGEGAVEKLLKGDSFMEAFLNHTHGYSDMGVPALTTPVTSSPLPNLPDKDDPIRHEEWLSNLSEVTKTK